MCGNWMWSNMFLFFRMFLLFLWFCYNRCICFFIRVLEQSFFFLRLFFLFLSFFVFKLFIFLILLLAFFYTLIQRRKIINIQCISFTTRFLLTSLSHILIKNLTSWFCLCYKLLGNLRFRLLLLPLVFSCNVFLFNLSYTSKYFSFIYLRFVFLLDIN